MGVAGAGRRFDVDVGGGVKVATGFGAGGGEKDAKLSLREFNAAVPLDFPKFEKPDGRGINYSAPI
jgi:hypothetical protein